MSSTGHYKTRELLSGVLGESFVEEIELIMALDGIISEKREGHVRRMMLSIAHTYFIPYSVPATQLNASSI